MKEKLKKKLFKDIENFQSNDSLILENIFKTKLDYLTKISLIPQDASLRRYYRCHTRLKSYIAMLYDSSRYNPDKFLEIQKLLFNNEFKVPKIILPPIEGLIILEDLGKYTLNDHIFYNSNIDIKLYKDIIDIAFNFKNIKNFNRLDAYSIERIIKGADLFYNYYPKFNSSFKLKYNARNDFIKNANIYKNNLLNIDKISFCHRDFHADNIIINNTKIGILDFQDASLSHPLYDIVSFIEDVRLVKKDSLKEYLKEYYYNKVKSEYNNDFKEFEKIYYFISLLNNLRILGLFCKFSIEKKNNKYLKYIKGLEYNITNILEKKDFQEFKDLINL